MTFWPRAFCAVVCWFLSALAILVVAAHYSAAIPAPFGLGQELLFTLGVGVTIVAIIVATLYLWLWVWTREYW